MDLKSETKEVIDIRYLINAFIKNWYVFGGTLIISVGVAYLINKYSPVIFKVSTAIVIDEENNGFSNASSQLLQDIGFINTSNNFANEMLILQSTPIIAEAIRQVDFEISYYKHSRFFKEELYKSSPFLVTLNKNHTQPVNTEIFIEILNNNEFIIYSEGSDISIYSYISNQPVQVLEDFKIEKQKIKFNATIQTDFFDFRIISNKNLNYQKLDNRLFSFSIHTPQNLIKDYQNGISVNPPNIESTVAQISMESSVPDKAIDFLNSLTDTYLAQKREKKEMVSKRTVEYINDQLTNVKKSLQVAEEDLQRFRSDKQIIDISLQAEQIFIELNNLKNQRAIMEVTLKYVDYIQSYFRDKQEYSDLITPSAMGTNDPTLNNLVEELIRLNAEKGSFIENNQEKSPYLKKINVRIENLRNMISENINYIRKTTSMSLNDLVSRIAQLNNQIEMMPQTTRQLTGIERVFNINDAIYTYLLEKKSEAEIADAAYQSDAEVIQPAEVIKQVSPKKNRNYVFTVILGLVIPFVLFRMHKILKTTLSDVSEIKAVTGLPILGEVYHNNKKMEAVVSSYSKGHIAESFRLICVNLNYFMLEGISKTILINSSISGEGKSFIALNLAITLSNYGNKTILIGFDIRKPKIYETLENYSEVGLTSFLSSQASIEDVIQHSGYKDLDVIFAGNIPPNPSELISSQKTDELLDFLKKEYKYIIMDTPPVSAVSDAYVLMDRADLIIFVARPKRTPRKEFQNSLNEISTKSTTTCLVINDLPLTKKIKYGYGYYKV